MTSPRATGFWPVGGRAVVQGSATPPAQGDAMPATGVSKAWPRAPGADSLALLLDRQDDAVGGRDRRRRRRADINRLRPGARLDVELDADVPAAHPQPTVCLVDDRPGQIGVRNADQVAGRLHQLVPTTRPGPGSGRSELPGVVMDQAIHLVTLVNVKIMVGRHSLTDLPVLAHHRQRAWPAAPLIACSHAQVWRFFRLPTSCADRS